MSNQEIKGLSLSALKMKLSNMVMSLDRVDHPKHYYEKLYLEKSNAKNKVTRNDTPFYHERIINRKRERTSDKKKKILHQQISEENSLEEENENITYSPKRKSAKSQNKNKDDYDSGIKVTRLIMSKHKNKKRNLRSNNKINIDENLENTMNQRTKRNILRNKKMKLDDDFIYYNDGIKNLKSKSKSRKKNSQKSKTKTKIIQTKNERISDKKEEKDKYIIINNSKSKEKNNITPEFQKEEIINVENNINNNDNINSNIFRTSNKKIPEKDYYLNIEEKSNQKENNNMEIEQPEQTFNENNIQNTAEFNKNQDDTSNYSISSSRFSRFTNFSLISFRKIGANIISMKNSIMSKFKRNMYLFPLLILILFGIIFFLNEKYENFERTNIVIIFSILIGLIVLFNIFKYIKEIRNYKKIAKEDRQKLMELFEKMNIKKEDIGDNVILLNQFFNDRMEENQIGWEEYMKYVFPYLSKYLKKDGYFLQKQGDEKNDSNDNNYWKKL